jgi:hypothetical protein
MLKRIDSLPGRWFRRMVTLFSDPAALRAARSRRLEWFALTAYQKMASQQVPEDHLVDF